jgi:hypothetical protein
MYTPKAVWTGSNGLRNSETSDNQKNTALNLEKTAHVELRAAWRSPPGLSSHFREPAAPRHRRGAARPENGDRGEQLTVGLDDTGDVNQTRHFCCPLPRLDPSKSSLSAIEQMASVGESKEGV